MMAARAQPAAGVSLSRLFAEFCDSAPDISVSGLSLDSRRVPQGGLFLACAGDRGHGLDYFRPGDAAAVAFEPSPAWPAGEADRLALRFEVPVFAVENLRAEAGRIAARFYDDPSLRIEVIGITGTNGKTSCSHFLAQVLSVPGSSCAVMGTLGVGLAGRLRDTGHTTPDPVTLQAQLAVLADQGAARVAMEVSSHGLQQGRVAGVRFRGAIFTNLTRDHLDFHGDMQAYGRAKSQLFRWPGLADAIINADDPFGRELLRDASPARHLVAYGLGPEVRGAASKWLRGRCLKLTATGLELEVEGSWGEGRIRAPLLGRFNAHNLLAVLATALLLGEPMARIEQRMASLAPVAGRMQAIHRAGQPMAVVDYAHTPDALEQALESLRGHTQGRLWCVFGCGGDRDRGKRPLMGAVAEKLADRLILTDDNPRGEDGDRIIADILTGLERPQSARVLRDRATAIAEAVSAAAGEDLILVAGKGHEDYQLVGDLRLPFDDAATLNTALDLREKRQ